MPRLLQTLFPLRRDILQNGDTSIRMARSFIEILVQVWFEEHEITHRLCLPKFPELSTIEQLCLFPETESATHIHHHFPILP